MSTLNKEQLEAVNCNERRILCLAGAGTGKTTCMLARISRIVEDGVDPSSILVLTFTNAAAFEMKERYLQSHEGQVVPEFRTFHSFCYHLLSTDEAIRKELGFFRTPTIADEQIRKRIIKEAGSITNIKASIDQLEKKDKLTEKERYDYDVLKKAEDKLMRKRNTITFDRLCYSICNLFVEDHPVVEKYKQKYKYIFCDEYQDTDKRQHDFVCSFDRSNIFVVGDALQSIYSFRGADSTIIKSMSENLEWFTIKLHQNYRCPEPVCNFANKHSRQYASDSYRVDITPNKFGEQVDVRKGDGFVSYGSVDLKDSDYCINQSLRRSGSTAILCRTNNEVKFMQGQLERYNVPFRSGKRSLDIKHILRSVGDNEYLLEWLASYLNVEKYAEYIRLSTIKEDYTLKDFMTDFKLNGSIIERWNLVKVIRRICKEASRSVYERACDIIDVLEGVHLELEPDRCVDIKDTVDYIAYLFDNRTDEPGTDIYVGTIHSVKGLEFDNVFVMGVNGPNFQLKNEDNNNLYYVAITRAKEHLTVCLRGDTF